MVLDHVLESFMNDSSIEGLMNLNQKIIQDLSTFKNDPHVSLDVKEICIRTISLFENTHHSIYMYHKSLCFAMGHLNKSVHSFKTNFELDRNIKRIELFLRSSINTIKDLPQQCTELLKEFVSCMHHCQSNVDSMVQILTKQWESQDQLAGGGSGGYLSNVVSFAFHMVSNTSSNNNRNSLSAQQQEHRNRLNQQAREILNYSINTDQALKEMEGQRDHLESVRLYLLKLLTKIQLADQSWFMDKVEKFWPDIELICLALDSVNRSYNSMQFPVFPFKSSTITCL
ncbi:hypothetical protein CYY_003316 [Polysphondylium violaceum]|uniref:Uncharacterized protein n=1 Tax=Polysphondylium violaceum TaxID=133409 RepID=A0A8J4V621_9MYCE|nr:hypothetical protein CYY_003316 [Polysphondylium violaceum]